MLNHTTELYFESHITIEPVFGDRLSLFKEVCKLHKFRVADLVMIKEEGGIETPNQKDSFATGRSVNWSSMRSRTIGCVIDLRDAGFNVYRYKIENTLMDSKVHDEYNLLK